MSRKNIIIFKNKFKKEGIKNMKNTKDTVHYYVDGGLKKGVGVAAFFKKGYYVTPQMKYRRYQGGGRSSTDMEIRAIELAIEDAQKSGVEMSNVVIHTDQKAIVFPGYIKNKKSKLLTFGNELRELGVRLHYQKSTHDLDEWAQVPKDEVPKSIINSLMVHNEVNKHFSEMNRWEIHKMKKRRKRLNNKKAA